MITDQSYNLCVVLLTCNVFNIQIGLRLYQYLDYLKMAMKGSKIAIDTVVLVFSSTDMNSGNILPYCSQEFQV